MYNDLICLCNLFWGHMLSDMFHTNRKAVLDTLILTMVCTVYLIDLEIRLKAGVTGRLGMLTLLGT
jgi:hypothetical protein